MSQRRFLSALALSCAVGLMTGGCSETVDEGARVTGSVTMAGQAQEGVRVSFIAPSGDTGNSRGTATDAAGKFEILLAPGQYKVLLSKMVDRTGKVPGDSEDPEQDFAQLEASGMLRQVMPPAYLDPARTPLSVTVSREGQDLPPFDVKK